MPERRSKTDSADLLTEVPFSFCPRCGEQLLDPRSFVQEYWVADETIYRCWCRQCGFTWDLRVIERVVSHETED